MASPSELLGIKVKPETKDRVEELIEQLKLAGKIEYKGDVIDFLLQQADLRQIEEEMAFGAQVRELQRLTERITEVFINLAKQNKTELTLVMREQEEHKLKFQEEILRVEAERNELGMQLTNERASLQQLTESTKLTEEKAIEYIDRIEEQKRTIEMLNDLIETKEEHIESLQQLKSANAELQSDLASKDHQVNQLTEQLRLSQEKIKQQEESFKQQLSQKDFAFEKAMFEKEKELQRQYADQFESLRNQREEATTSLRDKLSSLQDKYNTLFEENKKLEASMILLKDSKLRKGKVEEHKNA